MSKDPPSSGGHRQIRLFSGGADQRIFGGGDKWDEISASCDGRTYAAFAAHLQKFVAKGNCGHDWHEAVNSIACLSHIPERRVYIFIHARQLPPSSASASPCPLSSQARPISSLHHPQSHTTAPTSSRRSSAPPPYIPSSSSSSARTLTPVIPHPNSISSPKRPIAQTMFIPPSVLSNAKWPSCIQNQVTRLRRSSISAR
jgi:hypothetical protein